MLYEFIHYEHFFVSMLCCTIVLLTFEVLHVPCMDVSFLQSIPQSLSVEAPSVVPPGPLEPRSQTILALSVNRRHIGNIAHLSYVS
jgi:hypothetical protein